MFAALTFRHLLRLKAGSSKLGTSAEGLNATTGPLPSDDQRIVATNFSPAGQAFLFATHTATCSSSCSYFVLLPRRPLPSPPPRYAQGRGSRYRAASPIPSSYAQQKRLHNGFLAASPVSDTAASRGFGPHSRLPPGVAQPQSSVWAAFLRGRFPCPPIPAFPRKGGRSTPHCILYAHRRPRRFPTGHSFQTASWSPTEIHTVHQHALHTVRSMTRVTSRRVS